MGKTTAEESKTSTAGKPASFKNVSALLKLKWPMARTRNMPWKSLEHARAVFVTDSKTLYGSKEDTHDAQLKNNNKLCSLWLNISLYVQV